MAAAQAFPPGLNFREIASATEKLRRAVDSLGPGGQITVQLISSAFAAVRRISELRRGGDMGLRVTHSSPEFNHATAEYQAVLKQWNGLLPRVHGWLLVEKARLEVQRSHAALVRTWLEANQQTR